MGLFSRSKQLNSMNDLLVDHLNDLYSAEQQLTKALPRLIEAAHDPSLKSVFQANLGETENQVTRLERIFGMMGLKAGSDTCEAMKGLIKEGEEVIHAGGNPDVKDAALIATAQRVEHYEMAGYGCARTFAQEIHNLDVARLLQETLEEVAAADRRLTELAESRVNPTTPKK